MDRLHPIERGRSVAELANAVVEHALALVHAAEIEAQGRKAAPDEGLIEQLNDLVVHRSAHLRMRVEDQSDRRAGAAAGMETSFEASLRAWENDFGHGCFGSCSDRKPLSAGALRRRVLYRGARSCGNRQESTAFEHAESPLSRPCGDYPGASGSARSDGAWTRRLVQSQFAPRRRPSCTR